MEYTIGEFSRICRVSVRALRLYHEKGLVAPDFIDPESGYRYYQGEQIYEVQLVTSLKELGFSLQEIKSVVDDCEEDHDLVDMLASKRRQLERRVRSFQKSIQEIESILERERKAMNNETEHERIEEKHLPELLIAGYRMKARYDEIGKGFSKLGRAAGRFISGPAMCLYYDCEYMEEGADYEACFPVSKPVEADGISCRSIPGGHAVTIIHKGPYNRLSESYNAIAAFIKEQGLKTRVPSREIYLKGPGMILKGNPEKYLTEIQFLLEE